MASGDYAERVHFVPGIAPVDLGSSTTNTDVINAGACHWVQAIIPIGAITGNAVVYVYESASVAASGNATAAWKYRLTSAVGTDDLGDITAGSASGITLTDGTDESKVMVIDIDPAGLTAGYPYVYVALDPGSVLLAGVVFALYPRYPQNEQVTAVV